MIATTPPKPSSMPRDLAARERLAQQPRRDQRERQRVGRGDDRADARREVPQRFVRAAEVDRVRRGCPSATSAVHSRARAREARADARARTRARSARRPRSGRPGTTAARSRARRSCSERTPTPTGRCRTARAATPRARFVTRPSYAAGNPAGHHFGLSAARTALVAECADRMHLFRLHLTYAVRVDCQRSGSRDRQR